MKTVSIHDAKSNLSQYINAAKKGEKIYIGGFGNAEVVLTKLSDHDKTQLRQRAFAVGKGKITAQSDAFSDTTEQTVASLLTDGPATGPAGS